MDKIRVLVVDDSFVVRRIVTEELSAHADIEVAGTAATGKIALDQMETLRPDLVILDIEMPEMDGLTALTHLRRGHPHTPVIMFSSQTALGALQLWKLYLAELRTSLPSPAEQAAWKHLGK